MNVIESTNLVGEWILNKRDIARVHKKNNDLIQIVPFDVTSIYEACVFLAR